MTGSLAISPTAPADADAASLRVALLGLGTLGSAVAGALLAPPAPWSSRRIPQLVAIGVRDPGRSRPGVTVPRSLEVTGDLAELATRDSVDVLVELLGGFSPATELISDALAGGRAVVTANKALLARDVPRLEALAREHGAALRFEAAVGGGVPILSPLARDLAANRWERVQAIVNGTTNFVLERMTNGLDYPTALAEAQAHGYAEADPSADVEGRDAADKLVLLARLCFARWLPVDHVRRAPPAVGGEGRPGITGLVREDLEAAARAGMVIKLVARLERAGDRLSGSVMPSAVARDSTLGRTHGATNAFLLSGQPIGELAVLGPGAGGAATSSAVLGDLLALARGEGSTWADLPPAPLDEAFDDGLETPRRWFSHALENVVSERLPLSEVRRLIDPHVSPDTPLLPVEEPSA